MVDRMSIVGFAVLAGLVAWIVVAGAGVSAAVAFWQTSSVAFVLGGTVVAGLLASPAVGPRRLRGVLKSAFVKPAVSPRDTIITIVALAEIARRDGLLALDKPVARLGDGFMRRALQMAIDGVDPQTVETVMDTELQGIDLRHHEGKAALEAMARFAPALGMMGTLIGLVLMLGRMDSPAAIGPGMAVALLTTLYGLVVANLVCLPLARRLAYRNSEELLAKTIALKGVLGVQAGDNPRVLANKLRAYLPAGGDGQEFSWSTLREDAPAEAAPMRQLTARQSAGQSAASGAKAKGSNASAQAGTAGGKPPIDDATAKKLAQGLQKMIRKQKQFVDAA